MPPAPGHTAAPGTDDTETAAASLLHADGVLVSFPTRAVVILSMANTINSYTMVSLFPYVGMMVKDLLDLQSINEVGEKLRGEIE